MRAITTFNGVHWIHEYQSACVDKIYQFIKMENKWQIKAFKDFNYLWNQNMDCTAKAALESKIPKLQNPDWCLLAQDPDAWKSNRQNQIFKTVYWKKKIKIITLIFISLHGLTLNKIINFYQFKKLQYNKKWNCLKIHRDNNVKVCTT